jgi:hypothetical protein
MSCYCSQAEIANQIDPLMLQVLEKCQQRKDQVLACQVSSQATLSQKSFRNITTTHVL